MFRKGQFGVQQRCVAMNFIDYLQDIRFLFVSNEQNQIIQLFDAVFEYFHKRVNVQAIPRQYATALVGQVQRLFDVRHKQTKQMIWYKI
jgi:hypothetical protein